MGPRETLDDVSLDVASHCRLDESHDYDAPVRRGVLMLSSHCVLLLGDAYGLTRHRIVGTELLQHFSFAT